MQSNISSPPSTSQVNSLHKPPFSKRVWKSITAFFERMPIYFFPLFLLSLEWSLRFAFKLNTQEFIGPTLAATGVGMTISLTSYKSRKVLKSIPAELKTYILENDMTVDTGTTRFFRNLCWVFTLTLTAFWIGAIIISTQFGALSYWRIPLHYWIGGLSYLMGLILSEVKERL